MRARLPRYAVYSGSRRYVRLRVELRSGAAIGWLGYATYVRRIFKAIGITGIAVITFIVGACVVKIRHYDAAFSRVAVGDSEASVVARLGNPGVREPTGQPYLRYTGSPCRSPCVTRLWWEWPIMPGMEAWSVEVGADRTVVRTYRWESP